MSFINVTAHGNLTRKPETKTISSGTTVTEFGIASNRKYKTAGGEAREDVCFLDCTAFGKTGDLIAEWFDKGRGIIVMGRLKQESWNDKQSGAKRSKHVLVVEGFDFVGNKSDGDGGDSAPRRPDDQRQPQRQSRPAQGQRPETPQQEAPFGEEKMFEENDIPFIWSGRRGEPV